MIEIICMEERTFAGICERIRKLSDRVESIYGNGMHDEKWISGRDVCELLGISIRSLQNYRDTGKLAYSRIGNKLYYHYNDVLNFVDKFTNDEK